MTHRLTPGDEPTQCKHPHRAVARTSIAAAVTAVPILWPIVDRELGPVWATCAVVAAVAGNALITRILAVPGVEAWLRDVIPALSAGSDADDQVSTGRHRRLDLSAPLPALCASAADVTMLDHGGTVHAAATGRTVSGLVIPWNSPGPTTAGVLTIARNAVRLPRDLSRVKLHFKHTGTEGHRVVGYGTGYDVRPDGLYMTFAVGRTPDGDAALCQVTEGIYDAFSAELASIRRDGSTVTDSIMTGVALVDTPAFSDARVTEVHAAHQGETMNVLQFLLAMIGAGQTEAQARAAAVEHFGQAAVDGVTADQLAPPAADPATPPDAAPAADPAPASDPAPALAGAGAAHASYSRPIVPQGLTPPAPAVVHASAYEAAETLVRMIGHRGDVAHAALTDITNSGLTDALPPQWLGEMWTGPAKTRRLVPLLNRRDLRSWRIQGFRWTQKPLVAEYAGDKAEIPTGPVSVAPYEAEATRWAGGHDLDRKFFDFGDAGILESYWRAMHESYAVVTDSAAGAFVVANATTITDPAATDVLNAMIALHEATDDALNVAPSFYLANPADKRSLLSLTNQNLPAFLDMFGVTPRSIVWTKAVPAGTMVGGAKPAVTFHELPGSPLRVEAEHLSHGGRDRAMFGYTALTVDNPAGLVKVEFA